MRWAPSDERADRRRKAAEHEDRHSDGRAPEYERGDRHPAVSNGAELTAPNALRSSQTTPKMALEEHQKRETTKQPMRRAIRRP